MINKHNIIVWFDFGQLICWTLDKNLKIVLTQNSFSWTDKNVALDST